MKDVKVLSFFTSPQLAFGFANNAVFGHLIHHFQLSNQPIFTIILSTAGAPKGEGGGLSGGRSKEVRAHWAVHSQECTGKLPQLRSLPSKPVGPKRL